MVNGTAYAFENCRQAASGDNPGAVIVVLDPNLRVIEMADLSSQHVVALKICRGNDTEAITVVSAYFKYSMPTHNFIEKLRTILSREQRVMIGADVNGHSPLWHCADTNTRGGQTVDLIEDFNLTVVNRPSELTTYQREGMGSSNIDVTLVTPQIVNLVHDWSITDRTDSDHNVLTYNVDLRTDRMPREISHRYNTKRADWPKFAAGLCNRSMDIDRTTVDTYARTLIGNIQKAAADSMPRTSTEGRRAGKQPWWTAELTAIKKTINRMKRQGLHRTDRPAYSQARNRYVAQIRSSKMDAWRCFSGDINANVWGKAFSWAKNGKKPNKVPSTMVRPDGTMSETLDETAEVLLGSFFPRGEHKRDFIKNGPIEEYNRPVDAERVKAAIWRMRPGKAPGADGITAGLLRRAWPVLGEEIVSLFRRCITEATFPRSWKSAKLVVLPKQGKKDKTSPKSYRPISLLPKMAKALETLIIQDLETETDLNNYRQQHGFVPNRSTITAIKSLNNWTKDSNSRHVFGVFLDITGAFDNVGWYPLLSRLDALGASLRTIRLIQSYLGDRTVNLKIEGKSYTKPLERGCPQRSQLGPTLWKVAMTDISNIRLNDKANIVLYADDIALSVAAARPQTAHKRIEKYIDSLKQ